MPKAGMTEDRMESGPSIVAMDPYEWLPGHGETGVEFKSDGLAWIVTIEYDGSSGSYLKRDLRFHDACSFHRSSFPGIAMLAIDYEKTTTLGLLVEYPDSRAALAWRQHFGGGRLIRHFMMSFVAENVVIEVFAEGFTLGTPVEASPAPGG